MPSRDLTSVIIRCLQKAFPSADYGKGSFVWTAVINPIVEYAGGSPLDTNTIRDFMKSIMRAKFPTQEIDKDSTVDDLLMKPAEAILGPFAQDIDRMRKRQTLADLRFHTVESISSLAANYSVVPKSGDYARGSVRVYFAAPANIRAVPETYFESGNGLRFFAAMVQQTTATQMVLNMDGDLYYWDIQVVAEKPGTAYNVKKGSVTRAPTIDRAVRITNLYDIRGGLTKDTVEDVAAALAAYPTTRSIGTRRGTVATIDALVGGTKVVEVVGMGDPEMMRDIIRGGEVSRDIALYSDGEMVSGQDGNTISDGSQSAFTTRFRSGTADFVDIFGTSFGAVEGFYLITAAPGGKVPHWRISKIVRVLDVFTIEIEDRILPAGLTTVWYAVSPARLTLSKIPGGIVYPETPDGKVIIRDNEIHAGGCTDIFLLGTGIDQGTSDVEVLSDETLPGFGDDARTGVNSNLIVLNDVAEIETLGSHKANQVSATSYVFNDATGTVRWNVDDLTEVQAGQILVTPGAVKWGYRITELKAESTTKCLIVVLDDAPGLADIGGCTIIKRSMGLKPGACLQLLSGADAGYYRVLQEIEGSSFDAIPCQFQLRVSTATSAAGVGIPWRVCDTIDINLNEPKHVKDSGTDLTTFAGTDVVTSLSKDFTIYGVRKGDILRIAGGLDAAKDHVINSDPFGPGNRSLKLSDVLLATATVSYQVFSSTTPVARPLVAMQRVGMLDADGAMLGIDVPYGRPLGGYASRFTNLASGVKIQDVSAVAGLRTVTGILLGGPAANMNFAANPMVLVVWHRQLGYSPVVWARWYLPLETGGFVIPQYHHYNAGGPFNLSTTAGWDSMVAHLNGTHTDIPCHPHWRWEERAGYGYLICDGYGTRQVLLGWTDVDTNPLDYGQLTLPGSHGDPIPYDYELGPSPVAVGAYVHHVMSRDVFLGVETGIAITPLAVQQDMIDVHTEAGKDVKDRLDKIGSLSRRVRMRGYHVLAPEGPVLVRVGFPSSGLVRIYFKDPTDFSVLMGTRFTDDESGLLYWTDPMLADPVYPGYPFTTKLDNGWVSGLSAPNNNSAFSGNSPAPDADFRANLILPNDILEVTLRDVVFSNAVWPYVVVAADQALSILEEGMLSPVTVTFPAGASYAAPQDAADVVNAAFGNTIAVEDAVLGVVRLRWSKKISFFGTALAGVLGPVQPVTVPPTSNNLAYSFGQYTIQRVTANALLQVHGLMDANDGGAVIVDPRLQYRILRPGYQRTCAKQMEANEHPTGVYYADVEVLSFGVGNEYNIDSNHRFSIGGDYSCRGYRLSAEEQELTFSMAEIPWMQLDAFFQETTEDDSPVNDQALLGSGVRLYYDRSSLVASAQALLNSREERDNNQSVVARHLFPHYVSFLATYAGGSLEAVMKPEIEELITGRDPTEPLDVSDIIGVLTQFGANHVDTPVELVLLRCNEDRTQDILIGTDRVETTRLTGFLPGNIILTRRP